MAEDINKKGMHNGFETLVKAIEVDLSSLSKKDDVATLRAMDAKRASIELAKERLENHKSFVNSIYESKKVLPDNNFEKAIQDEMNKDAIAAAKSFCYMAFLSGQFSAAPPLFLLQGPAGTGKTYLAVVMAVRALRNKEVERIILVRPAVEAGEKLGFLPGDFIEKVNPYLRPLYDGLFDILGVDVTQRYLEKNIIEIAPLAVWRLGAGAHGPQNEKCPATRAFELHLQRLSSGQQFVAMRAANVIKNLLHYMLRVVPQGVNT